MKTFNLVLAAGAFLKSEFVNASTCTFTPENENQGATMCPPNEPDDVDIVLELGSTFPAQFGSFAYTLFSCDLDYLYTKVSVEDNNSQPLKSGMRGLFFEDVESGYLDGWVLNADDWTFKSFQIEDDDFIQSNAPNFATQTKGLNNDWQCSSYRNVFDDVHCSRSTGLTPGTEVNFWGYRSDGVNHVWERTAAGNSYKLEGPESTAPNSDCGNWPIEGEEDKMPDTIGDTDVLKKTGKGLIEAVVVILAAVILCCLLCCICVCCCRKRKSKKEPEPETEEEKKAREASEKAKEVELHSSQYNANQM